MAFLARSLGGLGLWSCYRQLRVPIEVALAIVMVPALVLAMAPVCGRMALMCGVEDGFSIVRSARQGLMTVSDDRGRVLAERSSAATMPFSTMLATVPVRHGATLYQRWGDWFAWLNLFGVVVLIVLGCIRPRRSKNPARSITAGVLDLVMNFVPHQLVFLKQH